MLCEPALNDDVVNAAVLFDSSDVLPNSVAPSKKLTLPAGTVDPVTATVAVNVTDAPAAAGFRELVTVAVEAAATAVIVSDSAAEVEVANVVSPEYVAVMLCDPAASDDVEYVATNPFSVPLPSKIAPS
jgi:hypothetical protein